MTLRRNALTVAPSPRAEHAIQKGRRDAHTSELPPCSAGVLDAPELPRTAIHITHWTAKRERSSHSLVLWPSTNGAPDTVLRTEATMNDLQTKVSTFMDQFRYRKIRVSALAWRLHINPEKLSAALQGGTRFTLNGDWLTDTSQGQGEGGEAQKTNGGKAA